MRRLQLMVGYLMVLCCVTSCINQKSNEEIKEPLKMEIKSKVSPNKKIPLYNDRCFFFLRGSVKEMILSYSYSGRMLNDQELSGIFENINMHVCFNEAGLITRLYWEDSPYDYTLDEPDENGSFTAWGDPQLEKVYYYVPKFGSREDKGKEHRLTLQLDQLKDEVVVGSQVTECHVTLYNDGSIEKLFNTLFSDLGPGTDGGGVIENYHYADNSDEYPCQVVRKVFWGDDDLFFEYDIQFSNKDEYGNCTKVTYRDAESGLVDLTIIRDLIYY